MSLSDSKEVGSHNDPIDLCESSDDSESRQSTRSTAAARMSISDLKRLLNERGIDHSDCVEKGDLVERLLDDDSRAVCNEQESMGNFTIKELKFQLDKRGVDYSDCIEKSDLVRRLEMSAGMKRVVQSSTHPCERRKKAAAKRPRTSKQSVIDSHIKLSRTDLDFEKCARSPVVRDHTMTLRQMLGLDASVPKYYTDCSIDWIIISNFMIDFDYVLGVVPELYSVPTCVVFYGQADTVPALQTWKQATDVEYVYLNPSEPPKSPGNPLKYKVCAVTV